MASQGLGPVQETLFIPLAARAHEMRRRRPLIRDPKAVEIVRAVDFDVDRYGRGWGGEITVLRTAILDSWVRRFLADHPAGTVIEIGTGLNARFERVDNGEVRWIDLDLPDVIALRRRFFDESPRRRMVSGSVLDESWLDVALSSPKPRFLVAEGVLVYLGDAPHLLKRMARMLPGALLAFDTYAQKTLIQQHRMAARRGMDARWAWACDDPRELEGAGLTLLEARSVLDPPHEVRTRLSPAYRFLLPVVRRLTGNLGRLSLWQLGSP